MGALDYTGAVKIGGRISALATNAAVDAARQNTRQAPLPKDVDAALELAKKLFAEAGVPSSLLSKVKQDELTSSTLLPDKTASLIGSYFLPTGGDLDPSDALFFVAKWTQGKLAAEFTLIRIASSPTENETLRFVDQADLFLNGQDEIIVINAYYENYRYRVFGRADDGKGWKQIFETGILGCE